MFTNGLNHQEITVSEDPNDILQKVDITITTSETSIAMVQIYPDEKKVCINVSPDKCKSSYKELQSMIAHELMHYNVHLNRYYNNCYQGNTPLYYRYAIKILESNVGGILYDFARLLYSTYYQEVNAIVSQSAIDGENVIKTHLKNNSNSRDIIKSISGLTSIQTFLSNITTAEKNPKNE